MDVALKQRLVGASVLVIFGVTFIPMLLDGPPSSRIEAPIAIPDPPDARFETRLLPVGGDGGDQQSQRAGTGGTAGGEQESPQALPRAQRPPAVVTRQPAVATPSPDADTRQPDDLPATPPAGQTSVPARAAAVAPTTSPASMGTLSGPGQYVLQLGSFGNAANAARLVERLRGGGWEAYQEKVEMGANALYRVRVGGWADKPDAESAGERLLQSFADLEVSVRQVPGSGPPTAADSLKGWMVQMGSFNSRNNAQALRDRLRGSGFVAHVTDGGPSVSARYRVRVGPALDEDDAKKTREAIRDQLNLTGIVVDHP